MNGAGSAQPAPPDALVASGLVELVPTSGRALDVACGTGAQSVWLAARGLEVEALDISRIAASALTAVANAAGLDRRISVSTYDLDDGLPFTSAGFNVVVCQRFRAPHLYGEFVGALTDGGIAVVTVLSQTGAATVGPFHAPTGELANAFDRPDIEILFHTEAHGEESIVARRAGRTV